MVVRELASLELATKPASAAASYLRMFSALLEHGAIHNSHYSCRPVTVSLVALGEFEVAAKVVGLVGLAPSRPAEAALFAEVETQLAAELGDRLAELKADGAQMHIADLVDLIVERLARHQPTDGELPWLVGG